MDADVDGWTSSNKIYFQGATASWIDATQKLQNGVIDMARLRGPHLGRAMTTSFSAVLDIFVLWEKLLPITAKNESVCEGNGTDLFNL